MILGREPDPSGLEYYRSRLLQGSSRFQIIADLRLSQEGRGFNALLPGLDRALRPYRLRRWPVIGPIIGLLGIRVRNSANGRTNMMQNDMQVADGKSLLSLQ